MTEPISTAAWHERVEKEARKAFAEHQMREIGPGHWRISRPDDGHYWADIVVMRNCAISVWGDIAGCIFAYCSGEKTPEGVVGWMAKADVGYYGRQKAHIGMGGIGIEQYVDEVAIHDLRQRLKDAEEEFGEDWERLRACRAILSGNKPDVIPREVYTEGINAAIRAVQRGDPIQMVHNDLVDALRDVDQDCWEWVPSIGRVTSVRVIYALAAIERLWQLLRVVGTTEAA